MYMSALRFMLNIDRVLKTIFTEMETCKIQSVVNIMEQIKELPYSFNLSEVRQLLLLECIQLYAPDAGKN